MQNISLHLLIASVFGWLLPCRSLSVMVEYCPSVINEDKTLADNFSLLHLAAHYNAVECLECLLKWVGMCQSQCIQRIYPSRVSSVETSNILTHFRISANLHPRNEKYKI